MQETATIIAHIMFRHGAILNIGSVLRTLDLSLEKAAHGAYSLAWDSEDVMVAEFAQTKVIIVAGHQLSPDAGFTLTIALSPKDMDAIADPALSTMHRGLIQRMVTEFAPLDSADGILWQRASAPITADAVERIAEALGEKLALLNGRPAALGAGTLETAQMLPTTALTLQSPAPLPI